tara:strand:+ start:653 stop:901 length:249 start_codon:yes stop_codon:yes gene_type:complete
MSDKFTKGEWESDYFEVKSNGKVVADCGFSDDGTDKEERANANLIAAAPYMYAMLKKLIDESRLVYGEDYDDVEDLLTKARG